MTGKTRAKSLRALHWDEAKHPRNDKGEFARKGGGRWLAKVVQQVGARFGDVSMGAAPGTEPKGRLQTGKGGLIDISGMSKAARERFPKPAAPSAPAAAEPTTKRAFAIKVGDRFMHKGAEVEAVGVPRAGRKAGAQVTVVKVKRISDGRTGPITIEGDSVRLAGPNEPQSFVEVPAGRRPGDEPVRGAFGGTRMEAAREAAGLPGRTPGGIEASDDFLARMSAKRQAAKAAGGVTTSAPNAAQGPGVYAAMKTAGIERPDDSGAKSAISRADDRLRRGEDPAEVAGYLREQARNLELAREEVPEDDEQRYSELTQSIRSLQRTADAVEGAGGPKGRAPGGERVDTPRVKPETGGMTSQARQQAVIDMGTSFSGNPYMKLPKLEALTDDDFKGLTPEQQDNARFLIHKLTQRAPGEDQRRAVALQERFGAWGVRPAAKVEAMQGFQEAAKQARAAGLPEGSHLRAGGMAVPAAPVMGVIPPPGKRGKGARRGDLVLVTRTTRDYSTGTGKSTERTEHEYAIVTGVDKNGVVKEYSTNPDGSYPQPVRNGETAAMAPAEKIDVPAVMAAAQAHTYPNSDTPMPFASLNEATALAKQHLGDQTAKIAAAQAAKPVGRDPARLKAGDRVSIPAFRHGDPATTVEVTGAPEVFENNRYDRGTRVPVRVIDGPNAGKEGFHTFKKSDKAQVLPNPEREQAEDAAKAEEAATRAQARAAAQAGRTLSVNALGARPAGRSANYDIEGPTKAQAVKMAQLRQRHLADAEAARQRGDDDAAFNKDEQAFDLETDLRKFGYDVDNGRPTKAQHTAERVDVAKRRSFADSLRTPAQAQARQEARVAAATGAPSAGEQFAAETRAALGDVDPRKGGGWNLPKEAPPGAKIETTRTGNIKAPRSGRTPGGGTAEVPANAPPAAPREETPQVPTKATAFDQLLDPASPDNVRIKNASMRKLAEQMEAHGWKLKGQNGMVELTDWEAPDGRTLRVQFITGDKPHISSGEGMRGRDLTYKAAMAHVVTPTFEPAPHPSISAAMERAGLPSLSGKNWNDPGLASRDPSYKPLENIQRAMMSRSAGYSGAQDMSPTEAAAKLRAVAEQNRATAEQRITYESGIAGGGRYVGSQAQLMLDRADQFDQVAAELERMDAAYRTDRAEVERRAALPLDLRPAKLRGGAMPNASGRTGRTPGGAAPAIRTRETDEAFQRIQDLRTGDIPTDARRSAETVLKGLKRPELEEIYRRLQAEQPATPFGDVKLPRGQAKAVDHLVELAVGRRLDSQAIERAGRTPGGSGPKA